MNSLVDEVGRVIPNDVERVFSRDDRGYFVLQNQEFTYKTIYERVGRFFGSEAISDVTLEDFSSHASSIKSLISSNSLTEKLLRGPHIPFLLPQKSKLGLGDSVTDYLVNKAGESFKDQYPKFEFKFLSNTNLDLISKVNPNSRWETLNQRWEKEPVIGWYFPRALAGFAIPDHSRAIKRFPPNYVLSGIPEVASAFVGLPSILEKSDGKYPNLLALTGNMPSSPDLQEFFWFFEAYGWNLYFNSRSSIGAVSEYYSGGISVIAE